MPILRAIDPTSQKSLYFHDPDGNLLKIVWKRPNALEFLARCRCANASSRSAVLQSTSGGRLKRRHVLGLAGALSLAAAPAALAQTQGRPGVVLMHGKGGEPANHALNGLHALTVALEKAGYLVDVPQMCWSAQRLYDKDFVDGLGDADAAAARLRARGASAFVVAGLSIGGIGALAYGSRRQGLAGIVALAPHPDPHNMIERPGVAQDLERARRLIAEGHGDERTEFTDWTNNQRGVYSFRARTTPRIYVSFVDPDGPADKKTNAMHLGAPLLLVSGSEDITQRDAAELFEIAERGFPSPYNRHVVVHSDHMGTGDAATTDVLAWLQVLPRR